MEKYKVIEIKESVFENNDKQADLLREKLKKDNTFLLNLMSSPGSGKTTTVLRTIETLKDEMKIGVMEADIDSDVDANTVSKTG
ncbi:MAG: GTP-binding protein, partial [Paeniclostridium sordellii]|nr:GTP-binding protein [Paeniclostridium sordellii]